MPKPAQRHDLDDPGERPVDRVEAARCRARVKPPGAAGGPAHGVDLAMAEPHRLDQIVGVAFVAQLTPASAARRRRRGAARFAAQALAAPHHQRGGTVLVLDPRRPARSGAGAAPRSAGRAANSADKAHELRVQHMQRTGRPDPAASRPRAGGGRAGPARRGRAARRGAVEQPVDRRRSRLAPARGRRRSSSRPRQPRLQLAPRRPSSVGA